jgi:hypothetical protein
MKRLLAVVFFLLAQTLRAADVARDVPGALGLPLAFPQMNFGLESPVLDGGFSRISSEDLTPQTFAPPRSLSLTPAAPKFSRPTAVVPETFSSMPLNPSLPILPSSQLEIVRPGKVAADRHPDSKSLARLSARLRKRALSLKNPLKSLASWTLGGSKNSVEKGRELGDDLWQLLFGAASLSQGEFGAIPNPANSLDSRELGTLPNSNGKNESRDESIAAAPENLVHGPFWGQDPVVDGMGPVPSPETSLSDVGISGENTLLSRRNLSFPNREELSLPLSHLRQMSEPPVLVFMRVARRLLDFTSLKKIATAYRLIAPRQTRGNSAHWDFFEPIGHAQRQGRELGTTPNSIAKWQGQGDFASASIALGVPSIPNGPANLWIFLTLLPILIAAIAYRRSFL